MSKRYARLRAGEVIETPTTEDLTKSHPGIDPAEFVEIAEGQTVRVGDETEDGGQTFREREPVMYLFMRATAEAVKALAQGDPIPAKAQAILQKVRQLD